MSLSRRDLLRNGALLAAGSFMPAFVRRAVAQGSQDPGRHRVLVFLFLRGALDGLHAVVPYGEQRLYSLRPGIAPKPPGGGEGALIESGVPGFGFHPALEPMMPFWRDGTLGVVHACGSPDGTRSHFDAQDYLELGTPGVKATPDGWLARALSAPGERSAVDAVAISSRMPRALQGSQAALAFANLEQLRLRPMAGSKARSESERTFEALYGNAAEEPVATSGREAFRALQLLQRKLSERPQKPSFEYPNGPVARSLQQLAALIKSDVGLRVGTADAGGWDTHTNQPGQLGNNLRQLAEGVGAFFRDLGPRGEDVVLVAATEFGRTARQNGANGTDHGHGSVAFVLGGGVNGGKIHGRWPGLADDQLYEGRDLAVTTDLRAVLAAAVARIGAADTAKVFPGFAGSALPSLFKA